MTQARRLSQNMRWISFARPRGARQFHSSRSGSQVGHGVRPARGGARCVPHRPGPAAGHRPVGRWRPARARAAGQRRRRAADGPGGDPRPFRPAGRPRARSAVRRSRTARCRDSAGARPGVQGLPGPECDPVEQEGGDASRIVGVVRRDLRRCAVRCVGPAGVYLCDQGSAIVIGPALPRGLSPRISTPVAKWTTRCRRAPCGMISGRATTPSVLRPESVDLGGWSLGVLTEKVPSAQGESGLSTS